jgi:hypothetical protein
MSDIKTFSVIVLTDRAPVRVADTDWPIIASGTCSRHAGESEHNASRKWEATISVRQHADGRAIVSGVYTYETLYRNEHDETCFAGALLERPVDSTAMVGAIRLTAEELTERVTTSTSNVEVIENAEMDCIAHLPPEDLA